MSQLSELKANADAWERARSVVENLKHPASLADIEAVKKVLGDLKSTQLPINLNRGAAAWSSFPLSMARATVNASTWRDRLKWVFTGGPTV